MNLDLTKYSDKTLCLIYKEYINDKKKVFSTHNIESDFPNVNREEFRYSLDELKSNKLINLDILGNYSLTSDGIIYMEHRFQNKVDKVIDYISKLIP
ncbi:MAG: hypothetical protein ACI31R_05455 [Bacilli bacterium]